MGERVMTDEQVIEALVLCANTGSCRECPLYSMHSANCIIKLMNNTLDLIKRQQAEIDRLQSLCASKDVIINSQEKQIKTVKANAYKEFVKMLKARKYVSTDWSHGEHPYVVEEDDIDDVLWKMTEVKDNEKD